MVVRSDSLKSASNVDESKTLPSRSFPPVARADARVLILGSLPGQRSLQAGEYYAHPQNAFWRIMREITGAAGDYEQRCAALVDRGIALWDVLAESVRPGSMDADIRLETAQANDFKAFFGDHSEVRLVCFNGRKAQQMFTRFAAPQEPGGLRLYQLLPSTSPAYAAMAFADKLARWRNALCDNEEGIR